MGAETKPNWNKTTFIRCPKDENHPFTRVSAKLFELDGYQLAIMAQILSNNDDWNLVKNEIGKRMRFPERKFLKAWKELVRLGYIRIERMWGSYNYTIYEDPEYTTGTGADCMDHTTGSSTTCTGATLTTINKNYYSNSTTSNDASCYEGQFDELIELYPTTGTKPDGTTYPLKGKLNDCKRAYIDYLKTNAMTHDEIITALHVELNVKRMSGISHFQPGLLKWIENKTFEQYRGRSVEPVEMAYGTELI
jgi:hypothetical protein